MINADRWIAAQDVSRHYDELDRFYREIWGEHLHHGIWLNKMDSVDDAVTRLSHFAAKCADVRPGTEVCDVGCGYGGTAQIMAESYGANILGITLSRRQWHLASSRRCKRGSMHFKIMDWLNNNIPAETFDSIVAIESTEHMRDKKAFFKEAYGLLKPGGKIAVFAWLTSDRPSEWQRKLLLEPICSEGRLPALASLKEYRAMLAESGFQRIAACDITRMVKPTWRKIFFRTLNYFRKNPGDLKFLSQRHLESGDFGKSIFRIWLAYSVGAMRYGVLRAQKPLV